MPAISSASVVPGDTTCNPYWVERWTAVVRQLLGLRPRRRKRRGRRQRKRWDQRRRNQPIPALGLGDSETRQAITGSVDRFLQGEESTEDAISLLARRFPFGIAGMHSELSEWRGLRILMDRIEEWDSASPKIFLMFWKRLVWESQAAARRFDHNPPLAP